MPEPTYALPIPQWYFVLSTILLVLIVGLFVGLCFLVLTLIRAVKKVEEPVHRLLGKVDNDLVPKVESLMAKVEVLTEKVTDVADNARAITGTARGTVEKVSGGASSITNALSSLAESGVSKLRSVAPYIGVAFTVLKLIKEFRDVREPRGERNGREDRDTNLPAKHEDHTPAKVD